MRLNGFTIRLLFIGTLWRCDFKVLALFLVDELQSGAITNHHHDHYQRHRLRNSNCCLTRG